MFSLVKKLVGSFGNNQIEAEKNFKLELDKLEDEIEKEEIATESQQGAPEVNKLTKEDEQNCFTKTGIITFLASNHGIIDQTLIFDFETAVRPGEDLKVGLKVQYLAYKAADSEFVKVVKVTEMDNNYWDVEPTEKNIQYEIDQLANSQRTYYSVHQRSVSGIIVFRDKNIIQIDTEISRIDVEIDSISFRFDPQLYDRVFLSCNVQTDESFVDSVGEVVEVTDVYPTRSRTIKGTITLLLENYGVVDRECFFTFDVLDAGYKPALHDKVSADVIESERDEYMWRCTKVCGLEKAVTDVSICTTNETDKNGIVITTGIKFIVADMSTIVEQEVVVENDGDIVQTIDRVFFKIRKQNSQLRIKLSPEQLVLKPGDKVTYIFECNPKFFGYNEELVIFSFNKFKIVRKMIVEVGSVGDKNADNNAYGLNFNKTYKSSRTYAKQVWSKKIEVVPGVKTIVRPRFMAKKMGYYQVPDKLRQLVLCEDHLNGIQESLEHVYPYLTGPLTYNTYSHRLQTLIFLEEIQLFVSIRQYDCNRAHFHRVDEYLAMDIDNLSERRPSLMVGDSIRCTNPWAEDGDNRCYEGVIHKVLFDRIHLKFNEGFQSTYNGEDYRVEFQFSRFGFRKQHHAVQKVVNYMGRDFLFPSKVILHDCPQVDVRCNADGELYENETSTKLKWYNTNLNLIQKTAVKNVLRGEAKVMPYVIYGPPGTGKTMTLVETIIQIMKVIPNSRIIVATPSNSAADLIATRLINSDALKPGDFVRLVSMNLIEKDLIPKHLKAYCATVNLALKGTSKESMVVTESGLKMRCSVEHLGRHKITIGTCSTLGLLLLMGFKRGHFTHVLIDEAGQCTETETMIPICQLTAESGQVVLAGDPEQLGPTVLDKIAESKGLGMSFLERVLKCPPYVKNKLIHPETGYDSRLVTKLLYNYRSLPSILKMYSELFYDSELKATVDSTNSPEANLLVTLNDMLPENPERSPSAGAFFVGVRGTNEQDKDSPSWFNLAEAKQIFLFVIKLYQQGVKSADIGIITPYNKQVRKIRNVFTEAQIEFPKIGSVEEFQGQERDIILVSTVRSTKMYLHKDLQQSLGFVHSSKRMNVTISRARALLVIMGNPFLLQLDKYWKEYIKYCVDSKTYAGCELPETF